MRTGLLAVSGLVAAALSNPAAAAAGWFGGGAADDPDARLAAILDEQEQMMAAIQQVKAEGRARLGEAQERTRRLHNQRIRDSITRSWMWLRAQASTVHFKASMVLLTSQRVWDERCVGKLIELYYIVCLRCFGVEPAEAARYFWLALAFAFGIGASRVGPKLLRKAKGKAKPESEAVPAAEEETSDVAPAEAAVDAAAPAEDDVAAVAPAAAPAAALAEDVAVVAPSAAAENGAAGVPRGDKSPDRELVLQLQETVQKLDRYREKYVRTLLLLLLLRCCCCCCCCYCYDYSTAAVATRLLTALTTRLATPPGTGS